MLTREAGQEGGKTLPPGACGRYVGGEPGTLRPWCLIIAWNLCLLFLSGARSHGWPRWPLLGLPFPESCCRGCRVASHPPTPTPRPASPGRPWGRGWAASCQPHNRPGRRAPWALTPALLLACLLGAGESGPHAAEPWRGRSGGGQRAPRAADRLRPSGGRPGSGACWGLSAEAGVSASCRYQSHGR